MSAQMKANGVSGRSPAIHAVAERHGFEADRGNTTFPLAEEPARLFHRMNLKAFDPVVYTN